MWNQATNLPEMREQQQYSQYAADNSINDNNTVVSSQSTKSKKKFRLFSSKSSKNRDTKAASNSSNYSKSGGQCYCEECVREATIEQSSNNYYLPANIQSSTECYYPRTTDQLAAYSHTRALSSASQPSSQSQFYYDNSHQYSQHMPDERIDYIYPPPQQFPCECVNCRKSGANLTTELLPLDTQIPLQMMSDSALLCNIL